MSHQAILSDWVACRYWDWAAEGNDATVEDIYDWADTEEDTFDLLNSLGFDWDTPYDTVVTPTQFKEAIKARTGVDFDLERLREQKRTYEAAIDTCGNASEYAEARRGYEAMLAQVSSQIVLLTRRPLREVV